MNRDDVMREVLSVLRHVQARTPGITCIEITGSTRPLEDIEKFDSKRWTAARDIIGENLGIALTGEQIFRQGRSTPRTVDQIVDRICAIIGSQTTFLTAA